MNFTIADMDRRSREALLYGVLLGTEIGLVCAEDVLARMEVVERPHILRELRAAVMMEMEDADGAFGRDKE